MSLSDKPSENKSNWEPTILRLTAFPSPSAQFDDQKWWSELVGELPEIQNVQPRTGEKVEIGPYRNARLALTTQPTRIDWQYGVEDPPLGISRLSTLGDFHEAAEEFSDLMRRWFESDRFPNLVRLAFGTMLIQPVRSREAGYSLLKDYLHLDINLENASDFVYQINRQRNSEVGIPSLFINRLSKWSVLRVQQQILAPVQSSLTSLYALLELDVNTAIEYESELPQHKLIELFRELVVLGEEISVEGDVP